MENLLPFNVLVEADPGSLSIYLNIVDYSIQAHILSVLGFKLNKFPTKLIVWVGHRTTAESSGWGAVGRQLNTAPLITPWYVFKSNDLIDISDGTLRV